MGSDVAGRESLTQQDTRRSRRLQRHWNALGLAISFSIITLVTWTVACVLCFKPINFATYHDHTEKYDKYHYEVNDWARKVTKTLLSLLAAMSIPVSSSVCAKATAVYCQKHSSEQKKILTMRQTLALADKGWSDLKILAKSIWPSGGPRTGSFLLFISGFLCGLGRTPSLVVEDSAKVLSLGLLIPALQGALLDTVHLTVSVSKAMNGPIDQDYGPSMDPIGIVQLPVDDLVETVSEAVIAVKSSDLQPNLWFDGSENKSMTSFENIAETGYLFYATSFPVGTDTGAVQQAALRLNFSLTCEDISDQAFPASCPGDASFNASYATVDRSGTNLTDYQSPFFTVRVCAPSR